MRNLLLSLLLFSIVSCKGDEQEVQQIDQVINLYYKDAAGKDLLNPNLKDTFFNIKFSDLNGARDLVPITSFSVRKTIDTVNYIDYVDGAVRVLTDSINPEMKTYRSDFVISLTKKTGETTVEVLEDDIRIEYSWTPRLFQVSKIFYNGELQFSKVAGQPNIFTIIK